MSTVSIALPDALGEDARAFLEGAHGLLIGAERPAAADGRTFATFDPSSGREIAQVPHAGERDVDAAVAAARGAFETWSTTPAMERERLMFALAGAVEERARELAE
ncbi:MAG TPA: aldehyde dehydrogenase family protein, partial [Solirubrobacteraceae bacterium]|nr:aldehyde dehydrogenase family protein [Solirubrobacteraceae bacterium]